MESATSLIAASANCPLTDFTCLSTTVWTTNTIARQFYATLAEHCVHSSLRKILISGDRSRPITARADQSHIYTVAGAILKPLFCFTNLERVSLSHLVGFDLDDSVVIAMACAWPHIKFLSLTANPCRHIPPHVTLRGIYAFAEHCPSLVSLNITFDGTVDPTLILENNEKRVVQSSLMQLDVAHSPILGSLHVGRFLSAIFPRLASIKTFYEYLVLHWPDDEEAIDAMQEAEVIGSHRLWKHAEDIVLEHCE